MVNAYIFGQGPMTMTNGNFGCARNRLMGWSETVKAVEVVFATNTNEAHRQAIIDTVNQYNEVRSGVFQFQFSTADTQGRAPRGKIFVRTVDDSTTLCGDPSATGCNDARALVDANSYGEATILLKQSAHVRVASHEANHAMIGACHVAEGTLAGANSVMGSATTPRLTEWEFGLLKEVFLEKGLRPGATSDDFIRAGITLNNGTTSQSQSFGVLSGLMRMPSVP